MWHAGDCKQDFVVNRERNSLLGGHRCRWDDNIEGDMKLIGWKNMGCISLAQDRDKY